MWTVNFFLRAEGHSTPVMFIKDQSDFLIRTRIWGLFSPQNTQELPVTRLKVFVHSRWNCHFESGFWSVGWGWENRSTVKKPLRQLCRTKNESQTQTLPTYDFDAGTWTANDSGGSLWTGLWPSLPFPCYFFSQTESLFTGYYGGSWVLLPLRQPCFPTHPPPPFPTVPATWEQDRTRVVQLLLL